MVGPPPGLKKGQTRGPGMVNDQLGMFELHYRMVNRLFHMAET